NDPCTNAERLGQKLFQRRKGTRITLTPAGERYRQGIEELIDLARKLDDPEGLRQFTSGRVTIGFFDDLAPFYLGPLLEVLSARLPEADVHYRIGGFTQLAKEMFEDRIDLSVTYDLGFDTSFERQRLIELGPCALVADGTELTNLSTISLQDLVRFPLILSEEGLSIRHVLRLFQKINAKPTVQHRVQSLEVMRSLVGGGEGIGISYTVPPYEETYDGKRIRAIPINEEFAKEPIILIRSGLTPATDLQHQAAEAILHFFRNRQAKPTDPLA
ncbi:LysR substrate-binding domain-containing protein, partial [Rhizobium sp. CF142]|uniref:LysR substrate-binding domain-containing protein n=1 Tax=Rhizobium sp. CF142 TaxID=1144314 RepID=UPI00026EEB89